LRCEAAVIAPIRTIRRQIFIGNFALLVVDWWWAALTQALQKAFQPETFRQMGRDVSRKFPADPRQDLRATCPQQSIGMVEER
jgi:hypothetical protein